MRKSAEGEPFYVLVVALLAFLIAWIQTTVHRI